MTLTRPMVEYRPWSIGGVIRASIAGAITFLAIEMVLVSIVAPEALWAPLRLFASIPLGRKALGPPSTFEPGLVALGFAVHLVMSFVFTLILSFVVHHVGSVAAFVVGALYGVLLYFVNQYGMTVVFPWFVTARNWVSATSHVAFGMVTAEVLVSIERRRARLVPT